MYIIAGVGFLGALLAFVLSFFPPSQIAVGSPTIYIGFLVAGNVLFVGLALIIYAIRRPPWKQPGSNVEMEPFSWEQPPRKPAAQQITKPATRKK